MHQNGFLVIDIVALAVSCRLKGGVTHLGGDAFDTPPMRKLGQAIALVLLVQGRGPVKQIGNIEILHIVPGNDIGIRRFQKGAPLHEHVFFLFRRNDLGTDNGQASLECKDVLDNGFVVSVDGEAIGNLNDGVVFGFGKVSLASLALDIERENAERRNLVPFTLGFSDNEVVVENVHLNLQ